jgi:hypothetical protein
VVGEAAVLIQMRAGRSPPPGAEIDAKEIVARIERSGSYRPRVRRSSRADSCGVPRKAGRKPEQEGA